MLYLVALAWLYVAVMMAVVEATSSTGTVLGAIVTFLLYGVGPVALLLYLLGTPLRRRSIRAAEARPAPASVPPDAGGHPAADAVAPVRKEP